MFVISDKVSKKIALFKFLLILLVIYVHSYSLNESLNGDFEFRNLLNAEFFFSKCVGACAVPGFYLISSILLYRKSFLWIDNLKKKFKTILVPYLVLNSFWILFYAICQQISFLDVFFSNGDNVVAKWGVSQWVDAYTGYVDNYPMLYPLYFLRDLFFLNIIAPLFKTVVSKNLRISTLFFLIIWFVPIKMKLGLMDAHVLGLWGLGCSIANSRVNLNDMLIVKPFMIVVYIFLIVLDFLNKGNVVGMLFRQIDVLLGIQIVYSIACIIMRIRVKKIMLKASLFGFGIFLFHEMTLTMLKKISLKIFPQNIGVQVCEYILLPLIVLLFCLFFLCFFKKYFPRIYGFITGNR